MPASKIEALETDMDDREREMDDFKVEIRATLVRIEATVDRTAGREWAVFLAATSATVVGSLNLILFAPWTA